MKNFNTIIPQHFLGFSGAVELGESILCDKNKLYWMDLERGSDSVEHYDFGEFIGTVLSPKIIS